MSPSRRTSSWLQDSTFRLLEEHGAAYCVMSGAGLPCVLWATAPFVYARLHGPDHYHLYAGSYSQDDLRWWADRVREWQGMGMRGAEGIEAALPEYSCKSAKS